MTETLAKLLGSLSISDRYPDSVSEGNRGISRPLNFHNVGVVGINDPCSSTVHKLR